MAQQNAIEMRQAQNKYGDYYDYWVCTGCEIEAAAQWQVEQACTCGDA